MGDENQLGLFGGEEPPKVRKVRRTKKKPEPIPEPAQTVRKVRKVRKTKPKTELPPNLATQRSCPTCESTNLRLVRVIGTLQPPELVTTFACLGCSNHFETRKRRPDVCEHGAHLKLPCEPCKRTWETIYGG